MSNAELIPTFFMFEDKEEQERSLTANQISLIKESGELTVSRVKYLVKHVGIEFDYDYKGLIATINLERYKTLGYEDIPVVTLD